MSSYEDHIMTILKKEHIPVWREKTFPDLKHGKFRFDFYIEEVPKKFQDQIGKKIIIEVDGEQHFKPIYGRAAFLKGQEHDRRKNSYCLANGIPLYRIPYWDIGCIATFQDMIKDCFLVKDRWHNDNIKREG